MLGPHILGECRVIFLNSTINSRQSDFCCAFALDAMYFSMLEPVGLVLFSAIETVRRSQAATYGISSIANWVYMKAAASSGITPCPKESSQAVIRAWRAPKAARNSDRSAAVAF
jgi:hypothetical protein